MDSLVELLVTSPPIVSSDLLESVNMSKNANPSYHDKSSSFDKYDGVSISPNGSDLSKACVKPHVM